MKKALLPLLLAVCSTFGACPEIRTGVLPNGFTYYIQTNGTPAGTADFFLAQRVGSVFERDDQRGLAHFIEHLCFNGTEHFPDNTMIRWLESKGVKFGSNLNAYTSTDETIYNISKVPVKDFAVVDSCLLIVRDWCAGQVFAREAVDAERGVIENEWRHRSSAANRMLEHALPHVYPGSIYGHRMPIGSMEVVNSVSPDGLREFYDTWYNPRNQALVVVGDVDADALESRIREMFGSIYRKGKTVESLPDVPANDRLIAVAETDPEQRVNMIQLHFRQTCPEDGLLANIISTMLADRFDDIELDPDCPHTVLSIGETKYLMSRGERSFVMRGVAKPGRAADAVTLWYSELSRALRHGFDEAEFESAKAQTAKSITDKRKGASNTQSTQLARGLVKHYLDGTAPEDPEIRYDADLARLDTLTLADVSGYLAALVDTTGRNTVIVSYAPQDSTYAGITPESLAEAFSSVNNIELTAYVPVVVTRPLLVAEPAPGKIVATKPYSFPGTTEYLLSNGIRVLAWPSSATPGQICIRGIGSGGLSMNYDEASAPTLKYINEILTKCGVSDMDAKTLKHVSAGRKIDPAIRLTNTEEIIEIATVPDDMEDAFRLIHAKVTGLSLDSLAVASMLAGERNKLSRKSSGPVPAMGDSIHRIVYSRHPLGKKPSAATVDAVDMQLAMKVVKDRFADMADFTFYVTGDFNPDSLALCLERYVASLPTAGRIEKPRDIAYRFPAESSVLDFKFKMESPVAIVYNFYHGPCEYNIDNVVAAAAFGRILKNRLLADLREDKGWTYGIQGHCAVLSHMNGDDVPIFKMPVYIKVEPGHEDEANEIVDATVRSMMAGGVTEEELAAVKAAMLKEYAENADDNLYRLSVMYILERDGKDVHTGYSDAVNSLTPDLVNPTTGESRMATLHDVRTTLIMRPE